MMLLSLVFCSLAWLAWAEIKLDKPYVVSDETRAKIEAKYSTRNRDAEDIRMELMKKLHGADSGYVELRERAKATYEQTLPCLRSAWMMDGRDPADFAKWKLPDDAEQHFEELKNVTAVFRQAPVHDYAGYAGPWLENIFIKEFLDKPLSYFNGFIPIFIQWIDSQILRGHHFDNIHKALNRHLRGGVIYLAVSQGDVGLGKIGTAHPNILVLSAGGFGHVPLPLVKGELPHIPPPASYSDFGADIVFVGNTEQASRPKMLNQIEAEAKRDAHGKKMSTKFTTGVPKWKEIMATAMFNLAPRGYGRSTFRFAEIIQMGRVPVFLWDDVPWIPYAGTSISIETFGLQRGLSTQVERVLPVGAKENYHNAAHAIVKAAEADVSLEKLVQRLKVIKQNKNNEYNALEQGVKDVRHFYTYEGIMEQIDHFITDPFDVKDRGTQKGVAGNYLRCTKHPRTERCCDAVTAKTYADSVHPYGDSFHAAASIAPA